MQQLEDNSAVLASKTIETSIFNVNGNSLLGPLIIGTFEKQAPDL